MRKTWKALTVYVFIRRRSNVNDEAWKLRCKAVRKKETA